MDAYIKTYQTVLFLYMHFIECQLDLNKAAFKKQSKQ